MENWVAADLASYDGFSALLYSFVTLATLPDPYHPPEVGWDGNHVTETMTLADVLAVMADGGWSNPHDWQRQKIVAMMDYCAERHKKFLWAFGGWSDLTKTVSDDQVERLVDQLVALLSVGGDGIDFVRPRRVFHGVPNFPPPHRS